jgi:hypothetical protein
MDLEFLDGISGGDAKPTITNNRTRMQEKRNKNFKTQKLKKAQTEKLALEEIQSETFINTLRDYYTYRDGDSEVTLKGKKTFNKMDDADMLEYFYNDRAFRTNNTISISFDLANTSFENNPKRLEQLAYISQTHAMLPTWWWNNPTRNFTDAIIDNGAALVADPINLISLGIGGQIAKATFNQTLKAQLKNKVASRVTEKTILEAARISKNKGLKQAITKGASFEAKVGAGIGAVQDGLLQNVALNTGVQDDFSWKQMGIATGVGYGFGTAFGAAFGYGGFKLTTNQLKNKAIKNLEDIHMYGRSEITGRRLFDDLTTKKSKGDLYKNMAEEDIDKVVANPNARNLSGNTLDERLKNLNTIEITKGSKPPKDPMNTFVFRGSNNSDQLNAAKYIKVRAKELVENGELNTQTITKEEIESTANRLGENPTKLLKLMESRSVADRQLAAEILAYDELMLSNADKIYKLGVELDRVDLDPNSQNKILLKIEELESIHDELIQIRKVNVQNITVAFASLGKSRKLISVEELKLNPTNLKMKKLKTGTREQQLEFYRSLGKLNSDEQIEVALTNHRKFEGWDLAAEYVNNNLLSSPDTHILNIASGVANAYFKPATMLVRAGWMLRQDRVRAGYIAKEAIDTYYYMHKYIFEGIMAFGKGFARGRAILDPIQMKHDSNVRQGQLQRWINGWGDILTQPFGAVGRGVNNFVIKPTSAVVTTPMRVLSAGDEFMKTITFKARRSAQINSIIMSKHPEVIGGLGFNRFKERAQYKELFKKYASEYQNKQGAAISTNEINFGIKAGDKSGVDNSINDPLEYAREVTYTQSAVSVNPLTGKREGGITGAILGLTSRHKWMRVMGMHFINTPSNLLRWTFHHLPFAGRYHFQMKQMLAKGPDGKYVNPEAAAEANARMTMGGLLWSGAVMAATSGKITGGGSKDWKANQTKEDLTGWQPYSYKTDDGRYISLNRLDPFMMPFFIAADMVELYESLTQSNDDLPQYQENGIIEIAVGVQVALFKNLTSKFYTKGILDLASALLGKDLGFSRDPERAMGRVGAAAIFKIHPLSGLLRYKERVDSEHLNELWSFSDRLRTLGYGGGNEKIMPRRNIFGEPIKQKRGWLLGFGKSGLWSSPFAMTQFKNSATSKFFEDRQLDYRPPSKIDGGEKGTGLNLKEIRNSEGQSAYDRMLELKQTIKIEHKGKSLNLKQIIEELIANPKSGLYKLPDGRLAGKDYRQSEILSIVHKVEAAALDIVKYGEDGKGSKEFPQFFEALKEKQIFLKEAFNTQKEEYKQQ